MIEPEMGVEYEPAVLEALEAGRHSDGKADKGKTRMSLLYVQFGDNLEDVAKILTYGAEKYPKEPLSDSWRDVPNAVPRYEDALFRHLNKYFAKGEEVDDETKINHLGHAICNLLFLWELTKGKKSDYELLYEFTGDLLKFMKSQNMSIYLDS